MANYKGIKGFRVECLASDPSNPIAGQTWFNTTSNVMKGRNNTTTVTFTDS